MSSKVSSSLPSVEELKAIKNYIFRIDADTLELRDAVQIQLDKLSVLFLEVTVQHPVKGTLIFGQNRENKISVSSLL